MSISLEDLKNYLRVDDEFEDNFLKELIEVVQIYIDGCVGEGYKTEEKKLKLCNLLAKKLIADMYTNRSTEITTTTKRDIIVTTMLEYLSNTEVL